MDVPDVKGRIEILGVHAKNKRLTEEVDLETIAKRTPGFSGADLANLLNEAAILTGRRGTDAITLLEIDDSVDRIVAGMEGARRTAGKAKSLVAYHEVGHAICGTLTPGHDAVQKVTLVPRGQAKGLTWFLPGEDPSLISKQQIFARVVGALGGRAAEDRVVRRLGRDARGRRRGREAAARAPAAAEPRAVREEEAQGPEEEGLGAAP